MAKGPQAKVGWQVKNEVPSPLLVSVKPVRDPTGNDTIFALLFFYLCFHSTIKSTIVKSNVLNVFF